MTNYYMTRAERWNESNGLMDVKMARHADERTHRGRIPSKRSWWNQVQLSYVCAHQNLQSSLSFMNLFIKPCGFPIDNFINLFCDYALQKVIVSCKKMLKTKFRKKQNANMITILKFQVVNFLFLAIVNNCMLNIVLYGNSVKF